MPTFPCTSLSPASTPLLLSRTHPLEPDQDDDIDTQSKRRKTIDWSPVAEPFRRLYKIEGRSLSETKHFLERNHNFVASWVATYVASLAHDLIMFLVSEPSRTK